MPRTTPPFHSLPSGQGLAAALRPLRGSAHSARDTSALMNPGLNFATQDYLSLGRAPLRLAQPRAVDGPAALADRIAAFLLLPRAALFPSGTAAIQATFAHLMRSGDHVVVDSGAPATMVKAIQQAGARAHLSPAGLVDGIERRLARLPRSGRRFVAVPAVAGFTSVTADLPDLIALCRAAGAHLIVDVSHDLGSTAQSGRGLMELQGCLGQVDIVLGSFAKSFGAPGGFVAVRDPDQATGLAPQIPAASPAILPALELIDSAEGRRRRLRLHGNALRLRNHLMADGLRVLGQPSPLVPVPLPHPKAEAMTALLHSAGPVVPLLRAPLVAGHAPRWRILLSSDHGPADIDDLADLIRDVWRSFHRPRRPVRQPQALPQP